MDMFYENLIFPQQSIWWWHICVQINGRKFIIGFDKRTLMQYFTF